MKNMGKLFVATLELNKHITTIKGGQKMTINRYRKSLQAFCVLQASFLLFCGLSSPVSAGQQDHNSLISSNAQANFAQGGVTMRPIEDFVSAQGTFCIDDGSGGCFLFVPPVANFVGWDTAQEVPPQRGNVQPLRCASVDYAGLANAKIEELSGGAISFGTTVSGTITERPLADGRAEVSVLLHTRNALTWVASGGDNDTCDYATDLLLFGHRVPDVLAGADAALGESFFQVKFINTAPGAPLPDLEQLFFAPEPGQEFPTFIFLSAQADGTLRENFGVTDGTPGRAEVTQTGLLMTKFKGATGDAFPGERINLMVTGK